MHKYQLENETRCTKKRASSIQSTLKRQKFFLYFIGALFALLVFFELYMGTTILMIKGLSVGMSLVIAAFILVLAISLEHAVRKQGLDWLDTTIKWSTIFIFIGWGAIVFESLEAIGVTSSATGKGFGSSIIPAIQETIRNINTVIFNIAIPLMYLVVGYLVGSVFSNLRKRFIKYNNERLIVPEWLKHCEVLEQKFQALDACRLALRKPTMSRNAFIKKGINKQKRALQKVIEVIDEALSKKDDWVSHINLITTADSEVSGFTEYLSQVRSKEQLIDMRSQASTALATY